MSFVRASSVVGDGQFKVAFPMECIVLSDEGVMYVSRRLHGWPLGYLASVLWLTWKKQKIGYKSRGRYD